MAKHNNSNTDLDKQELLHKIETLRDVVISLLKELGFSFLDAADIFLWLADLALFILGLLTAPLGGLALVALSILIAAGDVLLKLSEMAKNEEQEAKVDELVRIVRSLEEDLKKCPEGC